MYLSKRQSIVIASSLLGLFFLATYFASRGSVVIPLAREKRVATGIDEEIKGSSMFTLNNFERSEVRNGKKVWEVKAVEGQYFPEQSAAKVTSAKVWIYGENNEVITIEADSATLHLSGVSLSRAELKGSVRLIRNEEVTVETESALYDADKQTVTAEGEVKLSSSSIDVSGTGLSVDIASKNIELASNVSSVVKPRS